MTNMFSWQNSANLCPASFCSPRANLLLQVSLDYNNTISLVNFPLPFFFFFYNIAFLYILRIGLEVSSLIQKKISLRSFR